MAELRVSIEIDAPAEAVWSASVDHARQSEWILFTHVYPTYQNGEGVGGRLEAVTGLGPVRFVDTMEITVWDPPRRWVVRHTGRVLRGAGAFEVTPIGDGRTRFTWVEWLELPLGLFGQLGFALLRPLFAASLRLSLRKFARSVEAPVNGR